MSLLKAKVINIEASDNVHIIEFDFYGTTLSMMGLELCDGLVDGSQVDLQIKATYVAIGKKIDKDISYSNQIESKIINITESKLLTSIELETNNTIIESIITKKSSQRMGLKVGNKVVALIKASELSIAKVYDV